MRIRLGTTADINVLVEYNCALARETEQLELDPETVRQGVERGIARQPEARYFVADHQESVVGQLMLTREWSDWRNGWLVWIQSVYVHPDWRGKGVFRSLLDHAIQLVRSEPDCVGLRLYVETANERAQAVYERTGFTDPHYKVLERIETS